MTKKILYITSAFSKHPDLATKINSKLRIELLRSLGYVVHIKKYNKFFRIGDICKLTSLSQYQSIIIRIDGSQMLDALTLLKLRNFNTKIIWELHGYPEETLSSNVFPTRYLLWRLRRYLLSFMADAIIYISNELASYSRHRVFCALQTVIPNFCDTSEKIKYPLKLQPSIYKNKTVILWGGTGRYSWQALDVIHKVAQLLQYDRSIQFLIISSKNWFDTEHAKNIKTLSPPTRKKYLALLDRADICLALYHKPIAVPFYFSPLKIIDYMSRGKAIIATNFQAIQYYITNEYSGLLTSNNPYEIIKQIQKLKTNISFRRILEKNALNAAQTIASNDYARKLYAQLFKKLDL